MLPYAAWTVRHERPHLKQIHRIVFKMRIKQRLPLDWIGPLVGSARAAILDHRFFVEPAHPVPLERGVRATEAGRRAA